VRFYDRREIRDLMGYLKLIANPADGEAFRRVVNVPKRGIGDTSVDQIAERAGSLGVSLFEAARRAEVRDALRPAARTALAEFVNVIEKLRATAPNVGVDELLRELVDTIKYGDHLKAEGPDWQERGENVRSLIDGAAETVIDDGGEVGLTPLDHFLQKATLVAGVDALDANADAITLMTMHNAKGLEFPVVFITGLEDGLFPLARAYDDPKQLEEERRLFYVGITRAEEKLYLTHAEQRLRNGEKMASRPSGFLDGLAPALFDKKMTLKARSSGRAFMSGGSGGSRSDRGDRGDRSWGNSSWSSRGEKTEKAEQRDSYYGREAGDDFGWLDENKPQNRRPGTPVNVPQSMPASMRRRPGGVPAEEVGEGLALRVGMRVRHEKFGSGVIAELAGNGPDAKVRIDFDDEEIGRKTLVVGKAKLEPEID
jgi:DNA helicase-2/ATP-dependent DNA helicase PcrA